MPALRLGLNFNANLCRSKTFVCPVIFPFHVTYDYSGSRIKTHVISNVQMELVDCSKHSTTHRERKYAKLTAASRILLSPSHPISTCGRTVYFCVQCLGLLFHNTRESHQLDLQSTAIHLSRETLWRESCGVIF